MLLLVQALLLGLADQGLVLALAVDEEPADTQDGVPDGHSDQGLAGVFKHEEQADNTQEEDQHSVGGDDATG